MCLSVGRNRPNTLMTSRASVIDEQAETCVFTGLAPSALKIRMATPKGQGHVCLLVSSWGQEGPRRPRELPKNFLSRKILSRAPPMTSYKPPRKVLEAVLAPNSRQKAIQNACKMLIEFAGFSRMRFFPYFLPKAAPTAALGQLSAK